MLNVTKPQGEITSFENFLSVVKKGDAQELAKMNYPSTYMEMIDPDTEGDMPLHIAVQNGFVEVVKLFLQKNKANVDAEKKFKIEASESTITAMGFTSLYLAAGNGNIEMIELLLQWGAKVNGPDGNVGTPLHYAQKVEVLTRLLEAGADVNKTNNPDNQTPLHMPHSDSEVMKKLLAGGANVNAIGVNGKTALHHVAAIKNNLEVVKLLLAAGADPNIKDRYNNKASAYTSYTGTFSSHKQDVHKYLVNYEKLEELRKEIGLESYSDLRNKSKEDSCIIKNQETLIGKQAAIIKQLRDEKAALKIPMEKDEENPCKDEEEKSTTFEFFSKLK